MAARKPAEPFDAMAFGPIGTAVKNARPHTEADPIGVLAATLSLYSAALNGYVTPPGNTPVAVWTVLVGKSSIGAKGTALRASKCILKDAIGEFMKVAERGGVSSGPALATALHEVREESLLTEAGEDGRLFIVDQEWPATLALSNRCPKFGSFIRSAWDGDAVYNTTKGKDGKTDRQGVPHARLGFHAHIQPGLWGKYIRTLDAMAGTYNRILPVEVQYVQDLDDDDPHRHIVPSAALKKGYEWAVKNRPQMVWNEAARKEYFEIRREFRAMLGEMPENLACYFERAPSHMMRIATVLTAASCKTTITLGALKAARAFVEYSMQSVRRLVTQAEAAKPIRGTETLAERIERALYSAPNQAMRKSVLYSFLGSRYPAAQIQATVGEMPNVITVPLPSTRAGVKPVEYRLVEPEAETEPEAEPEKVVPAPRKRAPRKPRVASAAPKSRTSKE